MLGTRWRRRGVSLSKGCGVASRLSRCLLGAVVAVLLTPCFAQADFGPRVDGCGDVRFIGVKGSGQTGSWDDYGQEMWMVSEKIRSSLPAWVTYKSTQVIYPAYDTELLKVGDIGTYAGGVAQGDEALARLLEDVEDECPDELVLLGGYSSGAMIIHNALDEIAYSEHWADHIAGVHLLADPRRSGTDPTTRGSANSATWGIAAIGQWVSLLRGTGDVPSVFAPVTRSWCVAKDPVCALDVLNPAGFVANWFNIWRHSSYGGTTLPNLFVDEATRLTRRFRLQFPPTTQILADTATGWPVNYNLKGGFSTQVKFTGISPAIPGLTLTSDGHLKGSVPSTGFYSSEVAATTTAGGTTRFTIFLDVLEPFEMVDYEPEPVVLPPLVLHQPTGILLPGIQARSVVTVEDPLPTGLQLSSAGKLQGKPDLVGGFSIGVRVANPDGTLRRFRLELQVVNPAKLVSAGQDGTPSDSSPWDGILLDDSHAAFVSAASNLGVDNPGGNGIVYMKDVDSGALAHWVPPAGEHVCALETDAAKTTLYIVTAWWREFTNQNGDPDAEDNTTIRQIPLAGQMGQTGALSPSVLASFPGTCNSGAAVAPATAAGPAVISYHRLEQPGQPMGPGDMPQRLYTLGSDGFAPVGLPKSDGLAWIPLAIVDVRADGAILVRHERIVNTGEPGPPGSETGYFMLNASGSWRRIDLDASSHQIMMNNPRFYAGGIVFVLDNGISSFGARAALAIGGGGGSVPLMFKPIAAADPSPFEGRALEGSGEIQPLTSNDYATGCRSYKRSKPARTQPTTVYFSGTQIESCVASSPGNAPTPFWAGGPGNMLVSGNVGESPDQLLVAAIP